MNRIATTLRRIWVHPANRSLPVRLRRVRGYACYQLRKRLGLFPAGGWVIPYAEGLRFRLRPDSQLSRSVLYYGLGDWPSMQFLLHYLRAGDSCLDIGANAGFYTLLMAQACGPARIHAFEVLPRNVEILRDNLLLNGMENVRIHPLALADRDGWVTLNRADGDAMASISCASPAAGDPAAEQVMARRLDGFEWPATISYIKIDVEGAEPLVLTGAADLLRRDPPMVWSFEYFDHPRSDGSRPQRLLEEFGTWGYGLYLYEPEDRRLVPFRSGSPRRDDNVLAIHDRALDRVARRLCGLE